MTPFYAVVIGILVAVLLAMLLGVIARCFKDDYTGGSFIIALILTPLHLILSIIFPFIAVFKVYRSEHFSKMNIFKRLLWSLIAVPTGIVFVISSFNEITEEIFWETLRKFNSRLIEHKKERTFSVKRMSYDAKKSLDQSLDTVNERVWGLKIRRAT